MSEIENVITIRAVVTTARDHAFHPLRIRRVVAETADASSYVLEVPEALAPTFRYDAGQYCTFRVRVDGEDLLRCYSMSSAPAVDGELTVTVKRVPDGRVSNWMNDHLAAGDEIEVNQPAGRFCLSPEGGDLVAFAAGSGITPVFSLLKEALATGDRRIRLLYANRDRASTIFADELDDLVAGSGGRLEVVHHLDVESGFVDAATVERFGPVGDAEVYLCGPTPFMDVVEGALLAAGVSAERIHVERFAVDEPGEVPDGTDGCLITVTAGGRTETGEHHPGTTLLQTARQLGLSAPSSCEQGNCATCMARLEEGTVTMRVNDALTDDEVAEGWVLTCQSVPTSPTVRVVYEDY